MLLKTSERDADLFRTKAISGVDDLIVRVRIDRTVANPEIPKFEIRAPIFYIPMFPLISMAHD